VSRLVSRGKLGNPSYARPSPSVPRATSLHKFGSTKPPFWTMKSRRLAGCRKQKNLSPPAPVGGEIRNLSERLLFWEMHIGMSCELNILQDFLGTNRCDRGPSKSNNKSAGARVAYLMWRWLCQPGNRSTLLLPGMGLPGRIAPHLRNRKVCGYLRSREQVSLLPAARDYLIRGVVFDLQRRVAKCHILRGGESEWGSANVAHVESSFSSAQAGWALTTE